jgi:L-fuconolactonase
MQRIDAHQHFWKFDPVRDNWITDEMQTIRKDFLPADLEPLLKANNFDGCVAVQADQSDRETEFLLALSEKHDFIKGVVGWIDLQSDQLDKKLRAFRKFKKLKGFRHILQGEDKRDIMLTEKFKKGISQLQENNYTYDFLIYPDQLSFCTELAFEFPGQKFILDHLGKPYIKFRKTRGWGESIRKLAGCENTWCKLSGLVTEADWQTWTEDDFKIYLDIVVDSFGTERIVFGSDWPVSLLAANYSQVVDLISHYFSAFSQAEQEKIFGGNAISFYNL